jgi:hypothetical protein
MHIEGKYYTGEENGIEATLKDSSDIRLLGIGCSDFLFDIFEALGKEIFPQDDFVPVSQITTLFSLFGNFPIFSLPTAETFCILNSPFIDYLNQKIPFEELLGDPLLVFYYDETLIVNYIIEALATEKGITKE